MGNRLNLTRKSKIKQILEILESQNNLRLSEAAKAVYGSSQRAAQEKVIRLLSVYRKRGKIGLRVRNGQIVEVSNNRYS